MQLLGGGGGAGDEAPRLLEAAGHRLLRLGEAHPLLQVPQQAVQLRPRHGTESLYTGEITKYSLRIFVGMLS